MEKSEYTERLEATKTQIENARITLSAMIDLLMGNKPQVKLQGQTMVYNNDGCFVVDYIAHPINSDDIIVSGIDNNGSRRAVALEDLPVDKLHEVATTLVNQL